MTNSLSVVSELLRTLQEAQSPDELLHQAVSRIVQLTAWHGAALFRPCDEGSMLCVSARAGEIAPEMDWRAPADLDILGDVWQEGALCRIDDMQPDSASTLSLPGVSSALLVPLKYSNRVQLLLLIVDSKPRRFDDEDQLLAESLGEAIILALHNARLYQALQSELTERQRIESRFWATIRKTETLYRVSRSLNEPYSFDQILQRVVNSIAGALRADQSVLVSLDLNDQQVQHFVAGGPSAQQIVPISYDELVGWVTGRVIRESLPVCLSAAEVAALETSGIPHWYKGLESGSIAVVPLFSRSRVFGVLMVINRVGQADFTQQDVDLLMAIAGQISSAIQSAQLFQAVAEERGRLRALVQSSRDGVILLGLNMHLLVINRPALQYLGLSGELEDWINQWFWEALSRLHELSPRAVEIILREVRRVQAGDAAPGEGEFPVGSRIIHWLNLPMLGEERALGRLFVLRDVTEARLLERFREDLMHTMVHDLRNPLSGIYAGLQLLTRSTVEETFSPSQRQILEAAQYSTQRMLKLVSEILDINRLESGKMPLNQRAFHLADVVNDVLAVQQPLAEQRNLQLCSDIALTTPQVLGDRDLIERVIQNLVGNALNFTPEGGLIRVGAQVELETRKLQISINDTGTGIPPEIRERLFQKFVTGTQKKRGSGLGLVFCRMVLEAHNERIWVLDTSEQGTTFLFTLPLAEAAEG